MNSFSNNRAQFPEDRGVAAFEVLVREHHRSLLAYARALVNQDAVAEDLVQEAFVVAWKKFDEFDVKKDFGAWLRGITRFKYLHWARKKRETALDAEDLRVIEEVYEQWDEVRQQGGDLLQIAKECSEGLPERQAELIRSFYYVGMTTPEIAEAEHKEVTTIRKRLQRARDLIAQCIDRKLQLIEREG